VAPLALARDEEAMILWRQTMSLVDGVPCDGLVSRHVAVKRPKSRFRHGFRKMRYTSQSRGQPKFWDAHFRKWAARFSGFVMRPGRFLLVMGPEIRFLECAKSC
jgi:hypothetical protein